MGLKDRLKKFVVDNLRPWLFGEVAPILQISASELRMNLPHLELDMEALNRSGMSSSPVVFKEIVKVENLQLSFTPFRRPVLSMVVHGLHMVMEPRYPKDSWWVKKREKSEEQKQTADLQEIDPQGASVHIAAEGLAEGKVDSSLISRFIMSLVLTSVWLEVHDCSIGLVTHIYNECQHLCHISSSSLVFGQGIDSEGYIWSGGILGAAMAAIGGAFKTKRASTSIDCFVKDLGLQVKTLGANEDSRESAREGILRESGAAEVDEIAQQYLFQENDNHVRMKMDSDIEDLLPRGHNHVILLEELVLRIRFKDLGIDALEFDTPEAAFGLDVEEIQALQILTGQIQGPSQDFLAKTQKKSSEADPEDVSHLRSPRDLWKKGIQKAVERSSRRRLSKALHTGLLRRRYSTLYKSWLLELGWAQRTSSGTERERSKTQLERLRNLSEEISETQKNLPLEAIALARRLARHHVLTARHSTEQAITSQAELANRSAYWRNTYLPLKVFLEKFWQMIVMVMILMQGKASKLSMWLSAPRRRGYSHWISTWGFLRRSRTDIDVEGDNHEAAEDNTQSASLADFSATSKIGTSSRKTAIEDYFPLLCEGENDGSSLFPGLKKEWEMAFSFKIRRASVTVASGSGGASRNGESSEARSRGGELDVESVLIPAVHFTLEKLILAYGSSGNDSGTSMMCGRLNTEVLSILPSKLPIYLISGTLNKHEVFQRQFSHLGRWAVKSADRGLVLSSCPCSQARTTSLQTINKFPLANGMHEKHWIWHNSQLEVWGRSWFANSFPSRPSVSDFEEHMDENDKPFLIAEFDSLSDEPSRGNNPVGLIKCCLTVGQLNVNMKGAYLTRIQPLKDQLSGSQSSAGSNGSGSKIRQQRDGGRISLGKFWNDNYRMYLESCRKTLVSTIPERNLLMSAVIEGLQIRLFAESSEIYGHHQVGNSDAERRKLKGHLNMGASLVFDVGRWELALWPAQKKDKRGNVALADMENVFEGSNEWRTRSMEERFWVKRPPLPALAMDFAEKRYLEHEQVGNNLCVEIEDMGLILELQKDDVKELPIVGPVAVVVETSLCRDQYSSLFSATKSVSAAVSAKISSLCVQWYTCEVSVLLQVIGLYTKALKSMSIPDSDEVTHGETSLTPYVIPQEEMVHPPEKVTSTVSSHPAGDEVPFTSCALTTSFELEMLRLVMGPSRKEQSYQSSNNKTPGAQNRQELGLIYNLQEENFESVDEEIHAYSFDQQSNSADIGREAYVLIQNILLHISLGDGEQFCMFSGIKDASMRLMDLGGVNSTSELAEIRSHFFNAAVTDNRFPFKMSSSNSKSGLVLTQISLKYLSWKSFGPSMNDQTVTEVVFQDEQAEEELESQSSSEITARMHGSGSPLFPQTDCVDHAERSNLDLSSPPLASRSKSEELTVDNSSNNEEQLTLLDPRNSNHSDSNKDEAYFLTTKMEIGKVLVTDGSLDALITKVALFANGTESLHLDLSIDKEFQTICLGLQGGLFLIHTGALVPLSQFFEDIGQIFIEPAILNSKISDTSQEGVGGNSEGGPKESRQITSLPNISRSSSAPVLSAEKQTFKSRRTSSVPPKTGISAVRDSGPAVSPKFEGTVLSKVAGFSLVLARHSVMNSVPAEGVLFELELASKFGVGKNAKVGTLDLARFTILGLQERAPGDAQKTLGRTMSRTPQFGSSFKVGPELSFEGLSTQSEALKTQDSLSLEQNFASPHKDLDSNIGDLRNTTTEGHDAFLGKNAQTFRDQSSMNLRPILGEEEISFTREPENPHVRSSAGREIEGFGKAFSKFDSYILEHMSVYCAVEKVFDQSKVWKWSDAWQGQCAIRGLDVAITTSEIQLLESLVAPLSNLGGSVNSATIVESVADAPVEGSNYELDEVDFKIPDGAIIAIKDVNEHCYLAVEELPSSKGSYRLVGVLHYSLVGDRALFKVKYQDGAKDSSGSWFSLLSVHANSSDGESFRVHYRPGSGLAGISSTNDGSWEHWKFVPVKFSQEAKIAELNIRNPAFENLLHLVNEKSKSGIAFEENVPLMVKQPGNPFKVKIVLESPIPNTNSGELSIRTENTPPLIDHQTADSVSTFPQVTCTFDTFLFTILHEAGGGLNLLPLFRAKIPGTEGVVQAGLSKTRTIFQFSIVLEYYETQSNLWVPVVNPIETDLFYRARSSDHHLTRIISRKIPVTFFSRLRKVDFVISEASLDACLFLIGILELAGPYTMRYSPVRANRCLVENHTGVDLLCQFDQGTSKVNNVISSWNSDAFLMRHMTSRRDAGPAKVASSMQLYLQKADEGATLPLVVNLGDPGVLAIRSRLQIDEGRETSGPMVVIDVSKRNQDGIFVTVSPLLRIRNSSGLALELKCRREEQKVEGAVVVLEDGDIIDDSMGAFDAINLEGELKKALLSLNLGKYCLSIRPVLTPSTRDTTLPSSEVENKDMAERYEWSEDVEGVKPVRSSRLFDELQYNFSKTVKAQNLSTTFGVVFCPTKEKPWKKPSGSDQDGGLHFLIRRICRKVPLSRPRTEKEQEQQGGRYAFVAWQQQQELLLLPTVRVLNLLTSNISIVLKSVAQGRKNSSFPMKELVYNAVIQSLGKEPLYMELGDLVLTVNHEDFGLLSKPLYLEIGTKDHTKVRNLKDVKMELDFGDGIHTALVTVSRGPDGVLEVAVLTKYSLQNDSNVTILCCSSSQQPSGWRGFRPARNQQLQWPSSGKVTTLAAKSRVSWFESSTKVIVKRTETDAEPAILDLESVSGSMEISLGVCGHDNIDNRIQLGIELLVPSAGDSNPSCVIRFVPRYIVANDSGEAILVCQDGFQEDTSAIVNLGPGEHTSLHAQVLPHEKASTLSGTAEAGPELLLTVRFRRVEAGWNWSGPVRAAALGSFSVKIRRLQEEKSKGVPSQYQNPQDGGPWFAVADVKEDSSSLKMTFRQQNPDSIPYRIENALRSAAIAYNQKGLDESETLQAGFTVGYVWDDLSLPHLISVKLAGTSSQNDINPDKLRSWKSFRTSRRKTGVLQIPFLNDLTNMALYGDADHDMRKDSNLPPVGYEVYGDGPARVVRICEQRDSRPDNHWQSETSSPRTEIEVRLPLFTINVVEPEKQSAATENDDSSSSKVMAYAPVICLRLTNVLLEALITSDYTVCQLKAEGLDVDVKWQGAPIAAMIRGHGQDRFAKGHTVLHMAVVMSNLAKNPLQVKYASILLQAIDLNLDEDSLMKLVPFYRYSLSDSTAPSRQIYFERFEIHPIKIVGSFLPGNPQADYSSAQKTLRALLHSVIKIPTARGNTVELNGVLLSNALLTFKQLAIKCAQHYSWYSMRAIYIARGSKLLPPGFASLFDDSAASSLDVFFDPSNGSIDLQGLTVGMFGMLSRGLRNKGQGGTHRYLGDLQHTVKAAGSNLLFAVVTEVSDSVVRGADASGLDGLLIGFRRGILNVAMKPSVLRGAVGQGGSTRRIKLDRIVGTDEAYIEGYLQAMLDALFKQNYMRVKVIDDQVILKNLPPNTTLMEEIVGCVTNFLIGEGLLAGESSAAALSSLRRLRGEDDRRIGPTVVALCEQLLVIIMVRSLRRQTVRVLRKNNIFFIGEDHPEKPEPFKHKEEDKGQEEQRQGFFQGVNFRRALTGFALSSILAYADGRICRNIPNPLVRRIVSGFLLSFVE